MKQKWKIACLTSPVNYYLNPAEASNHFKKFPNFRVVKNSRVVKSSTSEWSTVLDSASRMRHGAARRASSICELFPAITPIIVGCCCCCYCFQPPSPTLLVWVRACVCVWLRSEKTEGNRWKWCSTVYACPLCLFLLRFISLEEKYVMWC